MRTLRDRFKRVKYEIKQAIKVSNENARDYGGNTMGFQEQSYGDGLRKALEIIMLAEEIIERG